MNQQTEYLIPQKRNSFSSLLLNTYVKLDFPDMVSNTCCLNRWLTAHTCCGHGTVIKTTMMKLWETRSTLCVNLSFAVIKMLLGCPQILQRVEFN